MEAIKNFLQKIYLIFFVKKAPVKKKRREKRVCRLSEMPSIKFLLNSLDATFDSIKRMTPANKETRYLVKRYGPFVGRSNYSDKERLGPGFKAYGLPTFLISYFDPQWIEDKADEMFLVATKVSKLPFFRPKADEAYYECFLALPGEGKEQGVDVQFNVAVDNEGKVTSYPYLAKVPIKGKGGRVTGERMALYTPDLLRYCPTGGHFMEDNPIPLRKTHLEEAFIANYNTVMERETGVNIIAKKGKHRATFIVPPDSWKYFFRERMDVVTPSGRKRPIFHAVMSHHRQYKSGKVVGVKTHYRGSKSFRWNGYSIKVVLPGKHAPSQASFGLSGEVKNDGDMSGMLAIDGKKMANILNKTFEGE